MKIALISPYHSGSHQAWAEGYARHSEHEIRLFTLPGRFWKWRMHGAAVTLAQQLIASDFQPDLLLVDDMLDASTLVALLRHTPHATRPLALYMHENQLTYPLHSDPTKGAMRRQHGERDRHYVFVNYASMLTADHIFFNSRYHLDAWFAALPNYLKHFPDHTNLDSIQLLREKSTVLPVGVNAPNPPLDLANSPLDPSHPPLSPPRWGGDKTASPLILWNQRWEYDKNPAAFFAALYALQADSIPFQLAVCGENFSRQPDVFAEAQTQLADHIVHWGFAERPRYEQLLWAADIVISTAWHEFFGISIIEAILHHTRPLLPNRLSYPELIPAVHHPTCLYDHPDALLPLLKNALANLPHTHAIAQTIAADLAVYQWSSLAPLYDQKMAALTHNHRPL